MKIITISGYKAMELGVFKEKDPAVVFIKKALKQRLIPLIEEGVEWFLCSGQLGVEAWAIDVIDGLKLEYPHIKIGVFFPFYGQEKNWSDQNKELFHQTVAKADFVDTISKKEYEGPWQFTLKNRFFVEKSDGILLVYDDNHTGSPKYLKETAENMKVPVIQITMDDLQDVVNEESWHM